MTPEVEHPNHRANRRKVAERLAQVLFNVRAPSKEVPYMDDLAWRITVHAASITPLTRMMLPDWRPDPSYTPDTPTRETVAKLLAGKYREAEQDERDPFEGLPT